MVVPAEDEDVGVLQAQAPQPDVLLVVVDTLRPDFLGAYGFEAPSSPNLDALAERGVVFERALAASSSTAPSGVEVRSPAGAEIGGLSGRSIGTSSTCASAGASYTTIATPAATTGVRPELLRDSGRGVYTKLRDSGLSLRWRTRRGIESRGREQSCPAGRRTEFTGRRHIESRRE